MVNKIFSASTALAAVSGETATSAADLSSLGIYTLLVAVVLAVLMFLTTWLGGHWPGREKGRPYESGIIPTGPARFRIPVQFYLVAIFFIIFDLESVFVYSWAVAFDLLGWPGFGYITFFIVALFAGLVYVWKKKGLEWGPGQ